MLFMGLEITCVVYSDVCLRYRLKEKLTVQLSVIGIVLVFECQ